MDYVPGPYNASFSAGQTIATIYIPIIDDDEVENDETFTLNITNASPFTSVTASQARITIVDNDSELCAIMQFILPHLSWYYNDKTKCSVTAKIQKALPWIFMGLM